jgi:hypothetical protein
LLLTPPTIKKQFFKTHKLVSHFSFDAKGAKEKLTKENAEMGFFAVCGRRGGFRSLHCAAF